MKPIPSLTPLGWLYGCGMLLRNLFFEKGIFRSHDVGVPVISVGNITAGGTGKTPVVDFLARHFLEKGKRVAVVSRGYGRSSSGMIVVSDGKEILATAEQCGDEPLLLARRNPAACVVVDEQRVRGAKFAIKEFNAEVIVLDDGFQHRAIRRTLDLVLIDAMYPPFHIPMLPAGTRRETLSALGRASGVILTKADAAANLDTVKAKIRRYTKVPIFVSRYRPEAFRRAKTGFSINMNSARGKSAVAFCGIAQPESFRQALVSIGMQIVDFMPFGDHHIFTREELQRVLESFKKHEASYIVTTEKDVTRCSDEAGQALIDHEPVFFLEMNVSIDEEKEWQEFLGQVA